MLVSVWDDPASRARGSNSGANAAAPRLAGLARFGPIPFCETGDFYRQFGSQNFSAHPLTEIPVTDQALLRAREDVASGSRRVVDHVRTRVPDGTRGSIVVVQGGADLKWKGQERRRSIVCADEEGQRCCRRAASLSSSTYLPAQHMTNDGDATVAVLGSAPVLGDCATTLPCDAGKGDVPRGGFVAPAARGGLPLDGVVRLVSARPVEATVRVSSVSSSTTTRNANPRLRE